MSGFAIRPVCVDDAEGVARVHVDTWRATYAGLVPAAHLAALDYGKRAAKWRELLARPQAAPQPMFVAVEDARIVGFAGGGPSRTLVLPFEGELYAIYLDPAAQKRGLGRALVAAVARALGDAGHASLFVWVLRENPACGFYARLGGELCGAQDISIGGATLGEVAYGWRALDPLLR